MTITPGAAQARDAARNIDGKFGVQAKAEDPAVKLEGPATPTPSLTATVQPQAWQRDEAVDAGDPIDFEVGDIIAEETNPSHRHRLMEEIRAGGHDLDELYFEAVRRGRVPEGFGPFNVSVDTDDFDEWEAVRGAVRVPDADLGAITDYINSVDPDDGGATRAIDDELVRDHVLLHYLEAGTKVGDTTYDDGVYMVTTRDSEGYATEAVLVNEHGVDQFFFDAIDASDRAYMKEIDGWYGW